MSVIQYRNLKSPEAKTYAEVMTKNGIDKGKQSQRPHDFKHLREYKYKAECEIKIAKYR